MIITFTGNTSLDQILFVPTLARGDTVRASRTYESMGGKGTDVSWILGKLGVPSLALGFIAGRNGEQITEMLHERGVETDFVAVGGESRRNVVIIDQDGGGQVTYTAPTLHVEERHVRALLPRYRAALERATCVVLAGTLPGGLPPSLYIDLIGMARAQGVPVIFDASEPFLSSGLEAGPTFVKPNLPELEALVGRPLRTVEAAFSAGLELKRCHGTSPILSLGEWGGLAILPERTYHIPPLKVEVVNSAGAGDGVLAGLAASVSGGYPVEEGIELGFAIATAVLLSPRTADFDPAEVERFCTEISLIPYKGEQC